MEDLLKHHTTLILIAIFLSVVTITLDIVLLTKQIDDLKAKKKK